MAYIFHNKMVYTLTVRTGGISGQRIFLVGKLSFKRIA